MLSLTGRRVFVAGDRGMVGSALVRRLDSEECALFTAPRQSLDLRDQQAVFAWLEAERPEIVIIAAAGVGGILANMTKPAEFLHDNLAIEINLIEGSRRAGVEKLLFLGSSCIYPAAAAQPIGEQALMTGPLEPTSEWYALAKIAGIKLCQAYRRQYGADFIAAMPTNLYGPFDNFDPETSHVLPALMRKIADAKAAGSDQVMIWGSGTPRREFLHVDDLADACVFLVKHYSDAVPVNIGSGSDIAIAELAAVIAREIGWRGRFVYDPSKPDGVKRKLLDNSRLHDMGWRARIALEDGIESTWKWYRERLD